MVLVPKTSVNEEGGLPSREDQVGRAWKVGTVDPKAQPERMRGLAHCDLRLRVLRPNLGHRPGAERRIAVFRVRLSSWLLGAVGAGPSGACSVGCPGMECHCCQARCLP